MRRYAFALLMLAGAGIVHAQSGNPYKLHWNVPGEELIYHACGCADSCWIAEIRRVNQKKRVIAALRCDCEKLHFIDAKGKDTIVSEECAYFNDDEKMERIPQRLKEMLSHATPN